MIFWWNFQNPTFLTRCSGKTFLLSPSIFKNFGYFDDFLFFRSICFVRSIVSVSKTFVFCTKRDNWRLPATKSSADSTFAIFTLFCVFHLLSRKLCDISIDYSALNGKIACLRSQERTGHRLKACLDRVACSPGSGPWEGDGMPRRYRGQKCVHDICTNAGGTAEGLPFVPMGGRGAFFFSAATGTGKSITS